MKITYQDKRKKNIAPTTLSAYEIYYKCFSEADRLIREELYVDQRYYGLHLHNWENLAHPPLLKEFYPVEQPELEFCIIDHEKYVNGYHLETLSSYDDQAGSLLAKTRVLYDATEKRVGYDLYQWVEERWCRTQVRKAYHNRKLNAREAFCDFNYDEETGTLTGFSVEDPHNFGTSFYDASPESIAILKERLNLAPHLFAYYLQAEIVPDFEK